ncbi:MAG: hypothetical protein GY820_21505 [Gammaproteobacteria bacterium]|nr:hypothetical protein [Gammaproteobacteria bacterium]
MALQIGQCDRIYLAVCKTFGYICKTGQSAATINQTKLRDTLMNQSRMLEKSFMTRPESQTSFISDQPQTSTPVARSHARGIVANVSTAESNCARVALSFSPVQQQHHKVVTTYVRLYLRTLLDAQVARLYVPTVYRVFFVCHAYVHNM